MALLNAFVENYMPFDMRGNRDFTGPRGWVHLTNLLLKQLEVRGLTDVGRRKEVGVEVVDNYWIGIPSDCREVLEIYYPPLREYTQRDVRYVNEVVNGKIKLWKPFDQDLSPSEFVLSEGTTTTVKIDDDDAAEDTWKNYLLHCTDSGDRIIIGGNAASDSGTSLLTFLHEQPGALASMEGYLTQQYLMLIYRSRFTPLEEEDDEIPIHDDYEHLLLNWLCYNVLTPTDKRYNIYRSEFERDIELVETEVFTPTEDQYRPQARSLPGIENCDAYDDSNSEYIGDGN